MSPIVASWQHFWKWVEVYLAASAGTFAIVYAQFQTVQQLLPPSYARWITVALLVLIALANVAKQLKSDNGPGA